MNFIERITISTNQCSYFLKRPFGNIIVFADMIESISDIQHQKFKSVGGISRLYFESSQGIGSLHNSLFVRYGCIGVHNGLLDVTTPHLKTLKVGEIGDTGVTYFNHFNTNILITHQFDKKIMFVGSNYYFDDKSFLLKNTTDKHEALFYKLIKKHKIDLIYFTHYQNQNAFSISSSLSSHIIKKLSNLFRGDK